MWHSQERAFGRYGKDLSKKDIQNICNLILNNQHIDVGCSDKKDYMKFAYVKYNHIPYKLLYIKSKNEVKIITMYPFDVDEYNRVVEERKIRNYITFLKSKGYIIYKNPRLVKEEDIG